MEQVIIGGIVAFVISFYAIPVIIQVANEKKLYDVPDERKIHSIPIPRLGGIAMFIGFIISSLLTVVLDKNGVGFQYYILAFLMIFFIGAKDDLLVLSPMRKFAGQVVVAGILIFKGGLVIKSMHGFMGLETLDPTAGVLLSFLTIIVVINAFNLIDGIDGLAGSLGLVTSVIFGTYFLINGDMVHALIGYTLAASIGAFLIYNFHPARIFMGDTGSMLLGVVNAVLVIHFIEMAPVYTKFPVQASPAIGFGILLIPLMDTLRVFGIRISQRRSPFSPDRNHLHHIMLDRGFTHRAIALSIAFATIACGILAFATATWGTTWSIFILIGLFFTSIYTITVLKPKPQPMHVVKNSDVLTFGGEEQPGLKKVKLVPLYSFEEQPAAVVEED